MSRTADGGTASHPLVVTPARLRSWPLPRAHGDKNSAGRVLVVGGNEGMPGAVLLAAESAMRAGAGKLQVATLASVAPALGVAIPEGYVAGLPAGEGGDLSVAAADRIVAMAERCDAVVLGPGFMHPDAAASLLRAVVPRLDTSVCLDALALAVLTEHLEGVRHLAGRCVLSTNPVELFATLGETPPDDLETDDGRAALVDAVVRLSAATDAVVVCGAGVSFVARPDGAVWTDEAGGQGLAVSGSGDVKAGIIVGLLARGASPEQAAVWADHVHGRCGERLASEFGPRGFMARDLPARVPQVLSELEA